MKIALSNTGADSTEAALALEQGEDSWSVYFRCEDVRLEPCSEAFVAIALLPCMRQGWNLELDEGLSPRFARGVDRIQQIFRGWNPALHHVEIDSPPARVRTREDDERGVGCFFTGGLDSFYTLLENQGEITDLIYVHGFDMALEEHALRADVSKRLREVADAYGKRLIEVESNLRWSFTAGLAKWGRETHGGALASVAHLLAPGLRKVYVASSNAYLDLLAWGTHPALDPHWSSESLELVHHGCEANRLDKAERVASSDVALRHLRVCFSNPEGRYNCGRCEKCMRTMIELSVAGALDRCSAFEEPLVNERVARILGGDDAHRVHYVASLHALERSGGDPGLIEAVRTIVDRPWWQERVLRWIEKRRRRAQERRRRPDAKPE